VEPNRSAPRHPFNLNTGVCYEDKIEVVTDSGTEIIPADQVITSSNDLRIMRLNNNRKKVLNVGTELSAKLYNLGCLVKLNKGEIYTEVEHTGPLFNVVSHDSTVSVRAWTCLFGVRAGVGSKMSLVLG